MNTIQFNKFSHLDNGSTIIFTHANYINNALQKIRASKVDTILISGNCDWSLTEQYLQLMPQNIIKWYSQNVLVKHDKVVPIPLGLMGSVASKQPEHGCVWHWAPAKDVLIQKYIDVKRQPTKFIYSNFNTSTNRGVREPLAAICSQIDYIDCAPATLDYEVFLNDILDHEMVVCPVGNGPDAHRFYEILYMDRIPIVFSKIMYDNLWGKFPCILLECNDQLRDRELLSEKLVVANKFKEQFSRELLTQDYWNNKILENEI